MSISAVLATKETLESILLRSESEKDRQQGYSQSMRDAEQGMGGLDIGSIINGGLEMLLGGLLSKSG